MTPRVRFNVLGPIRAWRDDREVDLGSPQQQATLAVLLLHEGRLALGQEFISALWGEDPPRAAAGTIRTYISRLRRALESGDPQSAVRIDSLGGGYALRIPAEALDLTSFQQQLGRARAARRQNDPATAAASLREAMTLWKGTPLAGLAGPYVQAQRAALEQTLLTAHEHRLGAELELGHSGDVSAELSVLAAQNPLREQFHEMLMLALYRSGRQAEALTVFANVRRQLAEDLGVDPGPRLQRLHQQLLRADPDLLGPAAAVRATDGRVVPRQLPADLPDFVGRSRVLADVTAALVRPDTVPVVAITGMGGIGKTVTALRAAHQVGHHFPDGQVFVGLAAGSQTPADPADVLAAGLRGFGIPDDALPASLGERAALWRTVLSDRRVLIVLDDAVDDDQLRHLLPAAPGSAVLVTGRRRPLDLATSHWSALEPFAPDEAVTLLARIAGADRVAAEPETARRLAAACSNVPYAIRLAGRRLIARPHWSIQEVADRIRLDLAEATGNHGHDGAGPVAPECLELAAPLQLEYGRLDEVHARAFRLLSVPSGEHLGTVAAAALLELPVDLTESVLESLADAHLLRAGRRGRYSYHDLVRLFARQQARGVDGQAACLSALGRLLRHYQASVQNALQLLVPGPGPQRPMSTAGQVFSTAQTAHTWLLSEHRNLHAAADQATKRATRLPPSAGTALRRLVPLLPQLDACLARSADGHTAPLLALTPRADQVAAV
jgi:DNA-binding SARP family transcriptional activator